MSGAQTPQVVSYCCCSDVIDAMAHGTALKQDWEAPMRLGVALFELERLKRKATLDAY